MIAINLKAKSDSLAYKKLLMPYSRFSFSLGREFMEDSPHVAGCVRVASVGSRRVTWRSAGECREPLDAWAVSKCGPLQCLT